MKEKYITSYDSLTNHLMKFGFRRKNANFYIRESTESLQRLFFTHATHSERFVKYYTIQLKINYPQIESLAKEMGLFSYGMAVNIGYLTPNRNFLEWRVAESDSEDYILDIIENMCMNINNYALPYFEKYSTLEGLLKGIDNQELQNRLDYRFCQPFLYYLLGDKKRAIDSLDTILKSIKAHSQLMDDKQNYSISSNDHVGHLQNKDLQVYMEFTSKFKDFVDESSDKPQEGSFKV